MGKGGGAPTQTTSTAYNTNIPEYARPYVETMLGATQKQLFQGDTDESGNYNITGFKPYQAYGGTYDAQGNQTSYDPSKAIAGFSPLQQQYQTGAANLQTPGQFGTASDVTGMGIMGAMGTAGQARGLQGMGMQAAQAGNQYAQQATNPYAMGAYMSPYMQNVVDVQQQGAERASQIQRQQNNAAAVGQGAFGGSRQGLVEAERQRNLATQKDVIQSQGLQNAFQNAQQAQQYGANLGLQGLQAGAGMYGQGIGAQQAAYGQAMQGAGQLAGIGGQELAAQQSILGAQAQAGAQQQAREQQIINQSMTDYANAQQYPLMQLGTMSNMLRGLPMQAQTTSQYAAAPNAVTQGIGAAGAIGSLMQANKAEGGVIKGYASGGITSYDVGGAVEADLEDMDIDGLQRQVKESSSPSIKRMAQRILAEKKMSQAPRMAGGGIIAFAQPTDENNRSLVKEEYKPTTSYMEQMGNVLGLIPRGIKSLVSAPGYGISDTDKSGQALAKEVKEAKTEQVTEKAADTGKGITDVPAVVKERAAPPAAAPTVARAPAAPAQQGIPDTAAKASPSDWFAKTTEERDRFAKDAAQDRGTLAKKLEEEAGPNAGRENYRAEQMAARANLKDEAERQKNMRLAEFFASWGSTPGPVLVAGMNALKKSIPGMVEDKREAKKLQRESDKIIYDIDEATRLEKAGYRDKADAKIQQAAANAAQLNSTLGSYAGHKLSADASMANAAATRAASAARSSDASEDRKVQRYGQFQQNLISLQKEQDTERKNPTYERNYNMVKIGRDENGVDKPLDKLPKEQRGLVAEARNYVYNTDKRHAAELRAAKEDAAAVRERTPMGKNTNAPAADTATVGSETYTRPAGMTDAQWSAYKKDMGIK
jgi:hypothetical protein